MKYKLIKTYPGSPKLHSIVEVKPDGYIHWNVNSNENNPTNYIHNSAMEQYEEFWQPIVEKDYKILEIQGKYGAISSFIEALDSDLKDKSIYKIKRLSDSEIFTIGDKKTNNGTISKFKIDSNGIRVFFKEKPINYHVHLNSIKHIKQKLFTTEDGVDIFEGDEVTWLFSDNLSIAGTRKAETTMRKNLKYFSTKEKAEEYIIMNKPCLSINDIKNAGNGRTAYDIVADNLIELVKSKL